MEIRARARGPGRVVLSPVLCGLDPAAGEDRERLGLGIEAYRIIKPTLPR